MLLRTKAEHDDLILRSLSREMSIVADDFYRAQCTQKINPDWRDGRGERIADMIASYCKQWNELRTAFTERQFDLRNSEEKKQ